MGISSVCDPPLTVKRSSRRRPARRRVRRPSAGAKGAITRMRATSPGRYSFPSGTRVTSSCSRPRLGGTGPPATHTRSSVSLGRPESSSTTATTLHDPPSRPSKLHRHRLRGRLDPASLGVTGNEAPLALDLRPDQPLGSQTDAPARDRSPVEVGDDDVHGDRLSLLHERPLGAQSHVQVRGVHQEVDVRRPGLPVDVAHRGLRPHVPWSRRVAVVEVDPQTVNAGAVRPRRERLDAVRLVGPGPRAPPRDEGPEDELLPVGRTEGPRGGGDAPRDLGPGQ